jgi:cation:H+ antiporter
MTLTFAIIILVLSASLLYYAGEFLVTGLLCLSRYFRVTEFVVAFFVMAFAASLPNLFVGVTSALQGVPELSFGDIMGNNMIALTLAVGCGILFAPRRVLPLENKLIQDTSFLTLIAAILPLILISDGMISRSDGLVLLLLFVGYAYWLYTKRESFTKEYSDQVSPITKDEALQSIIYTVAGIVILAIAAQGIVYGAELIAIEFSFPLLLIGLVMIGFGGALPEVYFTILTARRGETSMIVGNLMGAVIIPATFVLGLIAMIHPIQNETLEFPLFARGALVLAAIIFFVAAQSKKEISIREGVVLLAIYFIFLLYIFITAVL